MSNQAARLKLVVSRLGIRHTVPYIAKERGIRFLRLLHGKKEEHYMYRLSTPLSQHPLECRFGTSDREVFVQVFIRKSYGLAERMQDVRIILDLGANVGYASAYFLTLFPNARLIAVESDPANYAILCHNLQPFGSRVTAIHAAIWSHEVGLRVVTGADGEAWSSQVRECAEGQDPDVRGLDMSTLMNENGVTAVDLLKVDVEGAEIVMFMDATPWIEKIGTIMIELHGTSADAVFTNAMANSGRFALRTDRELTIAWPVGRSENRRDQH